MRQEKRPAGIRSWHAPVAGNLPDHMRSTLPMRRLLCCVAIASCTAIGALFAAERATVILSDGERMTGTLVSRSARGDRGRDDRGVDDLILRTDDGRELEIPMVRLAVIELGSARTAPGELDALPDDGTQMIVRRNGTREAGQFIGISEDGVVRWQGRNGRQEMIPSREVTRIYLDARRARTAFDDTSRARPRFRDDPPGGSRNDPRSGNRRNSFDANDDRRRNGNDDNRRVGGQAQNETSSDEVRVEANRAWTSTDLNVRAGDLVVFRASGRINFGQGATQTSGPEGNESLKRAEYPAAGMPVGALIGRVGNSEPFVIGANAQAIRMPANGALMLGVNDNELGDNTGFFTVGITRVETGR